MVDYLRATNKMININKKTKSPKVPDFRGQSSFGFRPRFISTSHWTRSKIKFYKDYGRTLRLSMYHHQRGSIDYSTVNFRVGNLGSLGLVLPRPIGHIIHLAGERQHLKFPLNIFSPRWQSLSLFYEYFFHRLCLYFQFSKLLKCEFPAATRYLLRPLFCQYIQMRPVLRTELLNIAF